MDESILDGAVLYSVIVGWLVLCVAASPLVVTGRP